MIDYESKVKCVRGREDARALCEMKNRFSDDEFDGKYNTNVEFRDSGSADDVSN